MAVIPGGAAVVSGAKAIVVSVIRTFVPWLVGVLVAVLTKWGVPIDDETVATLVNGGVLFLTAAVYYVVARLLEVLVNSKFGVLLGYIKQPEYPANPVV